MLTADPRIVDDAEVVPASVVRRSRGARVLRRQGAAPQHDFSGGLAQHSGAHPEQPPAGGRGHADHRRSAARADPQAIRRPGVQARHHDPRHHLDAYADGARLPAPRIRGLRGERHRRRRRDDLRGQRLGDDRRQSARGRYRGRASGDRGRHRRGANGHPHRRRRPAHDEFGAGGADHRGADRFPAAHGVAGGLPAKRHDRAARGVTSRRRCVTCTASSSPPWGRFDDGSRARAGPEAAADRSRPDGAARRDARRRRGLRGRRRRDEPDGGCGGLACRGRRDRLLDRRGACPRPWSGSLAGACRS